jgi:hypothetical protein
MNWSNAEWENQMSTGTNPMTADQITVILAERVTVQSIVPDPVAPNEPLVARSTGASVILRRERQIFSETTRSDKNWPKETR